MKTPAILLTILGLALGSLHAQTVPPYMNYQGTVTNSSGVGLGDSAPENRRVIFRIYDAAGAKLWSEEQTVIISKGQFSVLLGLGVAATYNGVSEASLHVPLDTVFASGSSEKYVGVTVGAGTAPLATSDAEISPRQRITSTAFSFHASIADTVAGNSINLGNLAAGSVDSTKLVSSAVTLAKMATGSVDSSKIVDGAVATADLTNGSVTLAKMAANSVDSTKLADGSVTLAKMAAGSVDGSKLANGSISLLQLANDSVDGSKIADDSIVNAHIAAAASIDAAKLATGVVSNTEFNFLNGVTAAIQTQLDGKLNLSGGTLSGTLVLPANGLTLGTTQLVAANGNVGIGKTPTTTGGKLQVAGDVKLGPTGQYFAPAAEENLRMVRGSCSTTLQVGTSNYITAGVAGANIGYSVVRNSTGNYTITFNTPFSGRPTVTGSLNGQAWCVSINQVSENGFNFYQTGGRNNDFSFDLDFEFIAVGPR